MTVQQSVRPRIAIHKNSFFTLGNPHSLRFVIVAFALGCSSCRAANPLEQKQAEIVNRLNNDADTFLATVNSILSTQRQLDSTGGTKQIDERKALITWLMSQDQAVLPTSIRDAAVHRLGTENNIVALFRAADSSRREESPLMLLLVLPGIYKSDAKLSSAVQSARGEGKFTLNSMKHIDETAVRR
jgi:hypothetical protein